MQNTSSTDDRAISNAQDAASAMTSHVDALTSIIDNLDTQLTKKQCDFDDMERERNDALTELSVANSKITELEGDIEMWKDKWENEVEKRREQVNERSA